VAYASCGDGTLTVVDEKAGKFEVVQVVKTPTGSRTMTVDDATNNLYLPAAEFEAPAPGSASRRPRVKPDSFMIVEVGKK